MDSMTSIDGVLASLEEEQWQETHQDLFRSFCINVFLGQWELARTCISPLCKNADLQRKNTDSPDHSRDINSFPETLYRICQYPFPQSLGSKTIPTPHHLSWLCLHELKTNCEAFYHKEEAQITKLWKDIDFRLLLTRIPNVGVNIVKELYVFFQKHVLGRKIEISHLHPHNDFLTTPAADSLKSVVLVDPCLGDSIIRALMTDHDTPESKNDLLQGIFVKSMNTLLDQVHNEEHDSKWNEASTEEKVLEILSFYDPSPYWNYLDLRQLLFRLIKLAIGDGSDETDHLTVERIISALCGRKTPYLLDEFSKIYFEVSSLASLKSCHADLNILTENQRQNLQLLSSMDRNICWRDYFISCQRRHVHFLAEILDLSLALVKAEKFMELQDVLSFPELQSLKPTVLLMGWSYCHSSTHARTLLETLWDDKVEGFNEMFVKICRKLAYHLDLMQWCLERTKPLLGDSESVASIHATRLLQGLDTHSVLYMLHHSTSLASLDHKEVLQLLSNVSDDKKDDNKRKSVSFEDEVVHSDSEEPVNVEQERDVAIFRSYCVLKSVIDAVTFGVENFEHELMNPVHTKHTVSYKNFSRRFKSEKSVSSSEGEESNSPPTLEHNNEPDKESAEEFINSYMESVVSKLSEAREHLSHLQPLTYRLEILEDLFSLLFLTHEDICDKLGSPEIDSDHDEEESKSFGTEKVNVESLNVSFVSEEEGMNEESQLDKTTKVAMRTSLEKSAVMSSPYLSQAVQSFQSLDYDEPFEDNSRLQISPSSAPPELTKSSSNSIFSEREGKGKLHESSLPINISSRSVKSVREKVKSLIHSNQNRPVGFLLNDYLVRDILHLMKEAISDLNEARFSFSKSAKQKGKKSSPAKVKESLEKVLQGQISTSVKEDELVRRITKLSQIINEAWWRFQLVAPSEISKEPNSILPRPLHVLDSDIFFLSTFEGQTSTTEEVKYDERRQSLAESPQMPLPSQSMSPLQSNVVSQLMASPESLLVFCLVKDNLAQAAQVMKLFKLSDKTPETMEFSFMNVYRTSSSHIWNLETEPREAGGPVKLGKRSVRALAKAAAVGVASASLSQIVEDLLQSSTLPPLPRPKSVNTKEQYPFLFSLDQLSAVLLDLLCTSCRTWETCNNMINLIKAKTNICDLDPKLISSQRNESLFEASTPVFRSGKTRQLQHQGIISCYELLGNIHSLIHYGEENAHPSVSLSQSNPQLEQSSSSAKVGLQHHLHSGFSSFKVGRLRSLETSLDELSKAVGKTAHIITSSNLNSSRTIIRPPEELGPHHSSSSPRSPISGNLVTRKPSVNYDQSPVHMSFKELMYAMEKYVPGDGLMQILLSGKAGKSNMAPMRNFMFSLYEHVKEMANLVVECEGNNQELSLNYFNALADGPVNILGRLMFVRKMSPHKLESVAKKLSLNLTHTIVHSCCPKIPSKHPPKLVDESKGEYVLTDGNRVYNLSDAEIKSFEIKPAPGNDDEKTLDPEKTVRDILTDLTIEMQDLAKAQNAKGVFDITCAKALLNLPIYKDIKKSTAKLRQLDLSQLESSSKLICFYANLANLMVLQCHLAHIQEQVQLNADSVEGRTMLEGQLDMCPFTALDYVAYFNSFSYEVGQLGLVSAFDVLTHLIRADFPSQPQQWNGLLSCAKLELAEDDPWKLFQPPKDARLLFAINLGCISSPPIQVLKPQTLESQLDLSMKNYLSHCVTIMLQKERVSIPEIIVWHEKDFIEESCQGGNYTCLVKWISNHVDADKQQALQNLFSLDSVHGYSENIDLAGRIELPFHVDVDKFDNRFSVTFDISNVQVGAGPPKDIPKVPPPEIKVTPGRPRRMTVSLELSGQSLGLELPTYNLTPQTLEYVKHDSLMVATMVSLVCADNLDEMEPKFADDHFKHKDASPCGSVSNGSMTRSYRSFSDIGLVDIRSYRYQRLTEDYPILQRHILHYILPMAAADNPKLMESQEPILKFVTNNIEEQVKLCMFSLPGSDQYLCVILDIATRLLEERKWIELLTILKTLPESTLLQSIKLQSLHDFTLLCYALDQINVLGQGPKVGNILRTFFNPTLKARTILTLSYQLPLDLSIDLLDCCLSSIDSSNGLWKALRAKYDTVLIFSKVVTCIKELRIKLSMKDVTVTPQSPEEEEFFATLERFTNWRHLAEPNDETSNKVIEILKKAGHFQLATDWASRFNLPLETMKEISNAHLLHLLKHDHPDTVKAFQLLDALCKSSEAECLSVCLSLVSSLTNPQEIKFVLSFVLEYLTHLLSIEDVDDIRLKTIGAKALINIPVNIRGEYSHLISCPSFILEQLLMNMKADLAGMIFEKIKVDFAEIQEPKLRMTQESFHKLISHYSKKAIEVNVVHVKDQSLTDSMVSNGSGAQEDKEFTLTTSRRVSADLKTVEMPGSPSSSTAGSASALHEGGPKQGPKAAMYKIFAIPTQPLPQDQWVPDTATTKCMVCKVERFSMFNRRHHCRICGRVVCSSCSTKQTNISGTMYRTCDECFDQIRILSQLKDQEDGGIYGHLSKEHLLGTSAGANSAAGGGSPGPSDLWKIGTKMLKKSMAAAVHHVDHNWKLRPDATHNDQVRSEFYYEQAPSVSLCISVLKQHVSRLDAGKMILSLCDTLSAHLVPISPGVPNPEIDYSLIISMMKQLLFQAKLDLLHTVNTSLIGQCDLYLTRVDLLRIMVESNYQDLPTIKELTKQDSVRRLRDKLIADERLPLAMEVSTKCGLDPLGVWSAMGFACLHMGNFEGARDKFSHCLKPPSNKNQLTSGQTRLLGDIINCLDRVPSSGITEIQMLLNNPKGVCDLSTLLVPSVGEDNRVDSVPYKECLFYLHAYGNYIDRINFLRQHGYWMKAVQFAVDKQCSPEVFITGLVRPALDSGDLGRLLEQMLMIDPTLEKWSLYLSTTCRYLLKFKYFYTLYHVQLFMKDFIRAAMTCITHFYQRGARSYLDLCGRLQFLFTAQQHLQAYLDPGQWEKVPHPLNPRTPSPGHTTKPWSGHGESAARLTLSVDEVKIHIKKVALQIEITKFLEQCLTQAMGGAVYPSGGKSEPSRQHDPPTLFGKNSDRVQLVVLVLLSGNDFKTSFNLVIRILQECGLNTVNLYTQCSRELAKQGRFEDIRFFITALLKEGYINDEVSDEIIGASLLVVADSHSQAKDESDFLIQLLKNDSNKINAFIVCGKLRSAYLLAVKIDSVQSVQRIAGAAQRLGQSAVSNICRKWLETHKA